MIKKNILIVDDNRDNRTTIELLLEDIEDVEISTATDGKEAVEAVKKGNIDIIFMDIMMPNKDGIEATKEIREFDKKVMIIAISALDDEESKKTMILNGCEDYIRKPIDSNVFIKRVKNYIELIDFRRNKYIDNKATNLFTKNVYNRELVFRINDKAALAEFWECYLTDASKEIENLSDCIRIIYAIGAFIVENGINFTIVAEENEEALFLTMHAINIIGEGTIKNILLKHYEHAKYVISNNKITFMLYKNRAIKDSNEIKDTNISEDDKNILRKTHTDKVSATEYVENTPINIVGKIEQLEEDEDDLDIKILDFERTPTVEGVHEIGDKFFKYALVIEELVEFQHLAYAIESFSKMLKSLKSEQLNEVNNKHLVMYLTNILYDLTSWRNTIFITKDTIDVHYLDSSLLSSCLQVEMIFQEKNMDDGDGELELF